MEMLGKPQRQHRIARLLEEQAISSQSQLVEMLAADGVMATQATVSRDLEELGAVKVRIRAGLPDVLGTVAGDDTLILVCSEGVGGANVAAELASLAGL